jgi:DNA-binding NarL/FixJ family response regulator
MRVLLAEDHKIVRQGTRMYLESMGVEIVGEATSGSEAVEMARALTPDVVIMDIHMPELTGIEATRRILHDNKDTRILVLTAYDDPVYVHALLDAGADGYVLKSAELSELFGALREVATGKTAFDPQVMQKAFEHQETLPALTEDLTDRELEVLNAAARGLTNKQIGKALFISDRTVQGHLQNIFQKLRVTSRTEAVTSALSRGVIRLNEDIPHD